MYLASVSRVPPIPVLPTRSELQGGGGGGVHSKNVTTGVLILD